MKEELEQLPLEYNENQTESCSSFVAAALSDLLSFAVQLLIPNDNTDPRPMMYLSSSILFVLLH